MNTRIYFTLDAGGLSVAEQIAADYGNDPTCYVRTIERDAGPQPAEWDIHVDCTNRAVDTAEFDSGTQYIFEDDSAMWVDHAGFSNSAWRVRGV